MLFVLSTVPVGERGEAIARTLVDERLAACVNLYPPMTSVYRWRGAVERDEERQLVIKTTGALLAAVQARLLELHPYELPEILILQPAAGSQPYLDWVAASVGREPTA